MNHLLVAPLAGVGTPGAPAAVTDAPHGVEVVPAAEAGIDAIGHAYWLAHGGEAGETTLAEAVEDVRRAFFGAYGPFRADLSRAARAAGEVVGAVLAVDDAPWDGVPPGPYVIDLFVVVPQRRRGIGRALMRGAMASAAAGGAATISLRVENDAVAARALYDTLGFRPL